MFQKLKLVIIIFFLFLTNSAFSITETELREYKYIDFFDFVSRYNTRNRNVVSEVYGGKKIDLGSLNYVTYKQPPEKYITFLEYRGASRRVDIYQKPFLLTWFKMSHLDKTFLSDDTAETILADQNFDLFYTATMYSYKGKTYYLTTQKAVSDAMQRELRNSETVKVYIWNLGQYSSDIPVFLIVGYERTSIISKDIQDQIFFQRYTPILRSDIFNRRFDKAKGSIDLLLKQYPGSLDLKLNQCLILNETNFFDSSISCYREALKVDPKNYDAYYGISMAYYNNSKLSTKVKAQNILENTSKAIELIQSLTAKPSGSLSIIMYNCYYLRAMAKLDLGDKTAIQDLMIVNQSEPALVSTDSIEIFKKRLGM